MMDSGQDKLWKRISLEWVAISYRTIACYAALGLVLLGIVLYLIAPNYFGPKMKGALMAISGGAVNVSEARADSSKREAHFVNIDGTVRVKKAGSIQWIRADYKLTLERGDFLQTGRDGVARLLFADGTNYLLKPDSLIAVEESRQDPVTRATRVAVQVSSGAVDLSTGKFEVAGSTSQVSFADAVASLAEESRAVVRNDPAKNTHQFTVDQGEADVRRGTTSLTLGQYEQVSFDVKTPGLVQQKVIAPPALTAPANMDLTLTQDPKAAPVDFGWNEVPEAVAYHLQVSPSAVFSKFVVDKKIEGETSAQATGFDEGTYYWVVSSIDQNGVESQPSPANRFTLVQQVRSGKKALLEVTRITQHGRVVEVVGRTEPGSSVSINSEQVFLAGDGSFRHFISTLPEAGSTYEIIVTGQNHRGDTNTVHKTIQVE